MTLEELRIGNKVISEGGTVLTVHGLVRTKNEDCIVHNDAGLFSYIDTLFAIQLTVELLVNYDFIYKAIDSEVGYWEKGMFSVYENEDGVFSFDCLAQLDYLHHLQNCYFDFIGTELCN